MARLIDIEKILIVKPIHLDELISSLDLNLISSSELYLPTLILCNILAYLVVYLVIKFEVRFIRFLFKRRRRILW